MFEFFFKYPLSVFSKGQLVLLGSWPRWVLLLAVLAAACGLGAFLILGRRHFTKALQGYRSVVLWALDWALLALLLLLLWQPAISVTALKQNQNIIAVVVDDSRSMGLKDTGESRQQNAVHLLESGLLKDLQSHYQVRMYRLGATVDRIDALSQLSAQQSSTQIGKGLQQLADEAATLPIGAIVLVSDGADNAGGIDQKTMTELQRRRLPVNTIGFGKTELASDVELDGFEVSNKALEGSRLEAQVTIRQNGFGGQHTHLNLSGGGKVLATREIVLSETGKQTETLEFTAGAGGVKSLDVRIDPLAGEVNLENNRLTRVLLVTSGKHRVLYVEGEPRWEYKFLRRAVDDDPAISVVSMLRTTQNKIYRQGIGTPEELAEGFPNKPEDLFEYDGLILGSVEEAFFTTSQAQAIKDFVDRRGGGLLFQAGRWSLADGGYRVAPFADLLPVRLPQRKDTFQRNFVAAELTDAGRKSMLCRIDDDAEKSNRHWEILPYLANYQDPGTPKPGAVVLANVDVGGKRLPLLVTENYGRGRSGVFATGGSWRWRMQQPLGDVSQETFWRQLLRWVVGATPTRVVATTPNANLEDEGHIELRAEVRDQQYQPASDAQVEAKVIAPDGSAETVALHPEPLSAGVYAADWQALKTGSYVAEVTAKQAGKVLGKDALTFRREDGEAENFHREQNKELLSKLAEQTGGRYYAPDDAKALSREISFSEAGITGRETREIWDMPAVFLLVFGSGNGVAVAATVGRGMRICLLFLCAAASMQAANYFVIVAGLGGEPEYQTQFAKWAQELDHELNTGPDEHVTTLSGPAATRQQVEQALSKLAEQSTASDTFALFLIGHGSFDGVDYKINLPGPDMTGAELARALNRIPAQRQLVVNMTSCGGASLAVLAKKDRVVISATKSGTEKNAPVFARYWVDALHDPAADTDKNGSISALEAFRYADRKTAGYFEAEKLLATEHAVITDTASATGVRDPKPENGQGLVAASFILIRARGEGASVIAPEKQRLVSKKEDLEAKIDRLKYQKAAMDENEYKQQLTVLLLELARTQAEIDK